jgi:DpnII restriction endonuclease
MPTSHASLSRPICQDAPHVFHFGMRTKSLNSAFTGWHFLTSVDCHDKLFPSIRDSVTLSISISVSMRHHTCEILVEYGRNVTDFPIHFVPIFFKSALANAWVAARLLGMLTTACRCARRPLAIYSHARWSWRSTLALRERSLAEALRTWERFPVDGHRNLSKALRATYLTRRHANRRTVHLKDEYDVQDLLHAILKLHFVDVRPEEWTPSYGGYSTRMDFLLKREQIVIEAKMTRASLDQKGILIELAEDIERYRSHSDCRTLICLVYDPGGHCKNPAALEHDLGGQRDSLKVIVHVIPKA